MSTLTYNNPPGIKSFAEANYYSQTVDLGHGIIKASGQGGWSVEQGPLGPIHENATAQIEAAFNSIDHVSKAAGLRGADDVYLVRSYHTNIYEKLVVMTEAMKRWIPSHMPVYTAIGTTRLAVPTMKIEIEVEAKAAAPRGVDREGGRVRGKD